MGYESVLKDSPYPINTARFSITKGNVHNEEDECK